MKPVIVFDIDDTLFDNRTQNPDTLISEGIKPMVMMYNALDYLINDPPSEYSHVFGGLGKRKPVDIFFLSARREAYREVTIVNLTQLLKDSPSSINRRLILGGDGNEDFATELGGVTVYEAKKECIRQLEAKGYTPLVVFDDDDEAIRAYKDHNPDILILKVGLL